MASWRSVHNHNCRTKKSKEQYDLPSPSEVDIFELTIKCMNQLGLDTSKLKTINDVKKKNK